MSRCSSSFSSSESDTESTEPVGQENEIEVVETRKKTGSYFEDVAFVPSDNKDDQEKDAEPVPPISFFAVYRYADTLDYMLLIVGTVLCLVQGGFSSVNSVIFRHLTDALIEGQVEWELNIFDYDKFYHSAMHAIMMYVTYGLVVFTTGFLSMSCWHVLCERQVHKIRLKFFESVMRQNIEWFDKNKAGALTTKLSDGIDRIKDGIGDKTGLTLSFLVQFVGGLAVSFSFSWKLSLVMMAILPAMLIVIAGIGVLSKIFIKQEQDGTSQAGTIAEEVVNGIRTVIAFNGQSKEAKRYDDSLGVIQKSGNKKNIVMGAGMGLIFFILFLAMGVAFWYGTKLFVKGEFSAGVTFAAFWAFMVAMFAVAQSASQIPAIIASRTSAAAIFAIIDRNPEIDTKSSNGICPNTIHGRIEINDVKFTYASRPDVQVLKGISLTAEPGQVIALVGHSGSGKSTIVSLLQRFYDVESGSISIDGQNISDLNVNWLRSIIGVVSQEPVLFAATIAENIRLGNPNLTDQQMEQICHVANAHEFISKFQKGYSTRIGDGGIQLSGGQKQRIAIARALARDPKILLLDEATSALDTNSERLVQNALDQATQGRTTLVVAHRLSTVRHCHKILVFESGSIKEQGTHEELMELDGIYTKLVKAQEISQLDEDYDPKKEEHEVFRRESRKRRSHRLSLAISNASHPELEDQIDRLGDEVKESKANPASIFTIIQFARKEWNILGIAFVSALLRGTSFPIFSIIYGQMFKNLATGTDDEKMNRALHNLIWFGLLGIFSGVTAGFSSFLFSAAGESITRRLRLSLFKNIVSQDGAYFDSLDHSPGKLSSRLATDAPNIRAAIDNRLGDVVQAFSAIITGIIIAFCYGPKMAPIGILTSGFLAFVLTAISQYLRVRGHKDALLAEEPSRLASEAIDHHRTVQSLGREDYFSHSFAQLNDKPHKRAVFRGVIQSLTFAFQSSYVFFNFAAAYRFGVFLVHKSNVSPYTVFQVIESLNVASMSMLAFAAYFPEYVRARLSAALIFKMLQDEPLIKSPIRTESLDVRSFKSQPELNEIDFDSVDFSYPINKQHKVLRNFNLNIPKGIKIALVGQSGCGKSTVIQLIERFYDPDSGTIKIGHQNLKSLDLERVRSNVSLVSQEPILFNYTIKENIIYGVNEATMDQVIDAAKKANAHQFITRLPNGYDTIVGAKGSQLSGGQKQRVSIARAIIRNPQILLLDEATSALDSQSEKLVQKAIDAASSGRTTVTIAHRLSTIQNSDLIVVFKDGKIAEQGTHQSLLAMNGIYATLTHEQGL